MLSEGERGWGEGCCQRRPEPPCPGVCTASTAACRKPGHCSALPSQEKAGTFTHPSFRLLGTSRCLLPSKGHRTRQPHSLPDSAWKAAAGSGCSGEPGPRALTCLQREGDVHPPVGPHHRPSPCLQGRDNGPLSRLLLNAVADILRTQEQGHGAGMALPSPHTTPSSTREQSRCRGGTKKVWPWPQTQGHPNPCKSSSK